MGLFDKIRGEFIDIIEWLDDSNDTLVHRFERYQNEIKNAPMDMVKVGLVVYLSIYPSKRALICHEKV